MSSIKFQTIHSESDLLQFQKKTANQVHVKLPMDYLQAAKVIALKDDKDQEIYGGFLMAHQGELRCLKQIPEDISTINPLIQKYKEQCFEINGLWLDHKKAPRSSRFELYMRCMQEALTLAAKGKSKYVYAYCAENQKLRAFYKNFHSKTLYEGPVAMLPGMDEPSNEVVEMGCMKKLPLLLARNPQFLIDRAKPLIFQPTLGFFRGFQW